IDLQDCKEVFCFKGVQDPVAKRMMGGNFHGSPPDLNSFSKKNNAARKRGYWAALNGIALELIPYADTKGSWRAQCTGQVTVMTVGDRRYVDWILSSGISLQRISADIIDDSLVEDVLDVEPDEPVFFGRTIADVP